MKKYLLTIVMSLMSVWAFAEPIAADDNDAAASAEMVYSVIGTINGNWDTDEDMVKGENGIYSAVFKNVAAGNYEFKVRVNHSWNYFDGAESFGLYGFWAENLTLYIEEDAPSVTIYANPERRLAWAVVDGTEGAEEKVYSVIGTINGNWDTDADMVKGEDGFYSVTFKDVAVAEYQFKIRVNHNWLENYGQGAKKDGANISIHDLEGVSDVTVFFNAGTGQIMWKAVCGDVNGDGVVNAADIVEAVNVMKKGSYYRGADVDGDGDVDVNDIEIIAKCIMSGEWNRLRI